MNFRKSMTKLREKSGTCFAGLIWDPNLGDLQNLSKTNKELWLNISFS